MVLRGGITMEEEKQQLINKINRYPKAEIVAAIARYPEHALEGFINRLNAEHYNCEYLKTEEKLKKEDQELDQLNNKIKAAGDKYKAYNNYLTKRYGHISKAKTEEKYKLLDLANKYKTLVAELLKL